MDGDLPLDPEQIRRLVPAFYDRVRADPELGPVFNGAIDDWPEHLDRLADFWCSVMLGAGLYKGNPMGVHFKHRDAITEAHFDRWLALWAQTTEAMLEPEAAQAMQERAHRIGRSLKAGLFFRPEDIAPKRPA